MLRQLSPTPYAYHHAAADLIHLYLTTHTFFSITSYKPFHSPALTLPLVNTLSSTNKSSSPVSSVKVDDNNPGPSSPNSSPNTHQLVLNGSNNNDTSTHMIVKGKLYYAGYAFGTSIHWMSSVSPHGRDNQISSHNRGPLRLPCIDSCYSRDKRTPITHPYGMLLPHLICIIPYGFI
jgi:hypothetical protein